MKSLSICLVLLVFTSAKCQEVNRYFVKSIESQNSWNIIYLERDSIMFKVVNKIVEGTDCSEIEVGEFYDLVLKSRSETAPEIDGIKLRPINKLDVECYSFDKETEICIEPERGINDIYITDDLIGLCLVKE